LHIYPYVGVEWKIKNFHDSDGEALERCLLTMCC
jgi:hypothetical protein